MQTPNHSPKGLSFQLPWTSVCPFWLNTFPSLLLLCWKNDYLWDPALPSIVASPIPNLNTGSAFAQVISCTQCQWLAWLGVQPALSQQAQGLPNAHLLAHARALACLCQLSYSLHLSIWVWWLDSHWVSGTSDKEAWLKQLCCTNQESHTRTDLLYS